MTENSQKYKKYTELKQGSMRLDFLEPCPYTKG